MFGGDAFEDTFGELNMWETMRMQFMMAAGAQLTEEQAHERMQKFAEERQVKLTELLVAKLSPFVADDVAKFKELIEGDLENKVWFFLCWCGGSEVWVMFAFKGRSSRRRCATCSNWLRVSLERG